MTSQHEMHADLTDDFIEDIFCDSCQEMFPEMMYIEHWERCKEAKRLKKQQQIQLIQRMRLFADKQGKIMEEKQQRYVKNDWRKFQFIDPLFFEEQLKPKIGKGINIQMVQINYEEYGWENRKQNTIKSKRNGGIEQLQCKKCGKKMTQQQYQLHAATCGFQQTECPYCRQQFPSNYQFYHHVSCLMQNGSQTQNHALRPAESVQQEHSFGNLRLTSQDYEQDQELWIEAKNTGKGLKEQQIELIAILKYKKKVDQQQPDQCTVCVEEMLDDADYLSLPCKHLFHPNCLKPWIKKIAECPNCKFKIKEMFSQKQ